MLQVFLNRFRRATVEAPVAVDVDDDVGPLDDQDRVRFPEHDSVRRRGRFLLRHERDEMALRNVRCFREKLEAKQFLQRPTNLVVAARLPDKVVVQRRIFREQVQQLRRAAIVRPKQERVLIDEVDYRRQVVGVFRHGRWVSWRS
ncbi:hypothetical protein H310_02756 [Aphanomyces invadans]|uniref:Uncharacterized protein n=1 Tax=Aphanomyces invadans TaxID=157072 RepID=A0A024UK26_9STRA|nr:hypothetical protein H310_02756 [Aphanomyces invadans]ETW06525.1 hypothetical protein H310_02756 [Aphanomyces invadans]|eukprot:XP_008864600.1 hypothetical protein H310_02756 [Aphanomyces invadans]